MKELSVNVNGIYEAGLNGPEFFVLLSVMCSNKSGIFKVIQHLEDDGKIYRDLGNPELLRISNEGKAAIDQAILKSKADQGISDASLIAVAEKLIEMFPKGNKTPGVAWRDTKKNIMTRLKKLFVVYNQVYTPEQIIKAAKDYITSFNGDYTYMRTLKYFILKNEHKQDENGKGYIEQTSDLAVRIENPGQEVNTGNVDTGEIV